MTHSFNTIVAEHTSVDCAILLHSLNFWCRKNIANDKNKHEGRYWTYNSVKAWKEHAPYLTDYKIRSALKTLEEKGMIFISEFNENKYDRTKWYSVNYDHPLLSQLSDFQIKKVDLLKTKNGDSKNSEPIPDSITDSITDVREKKSQKSFQELKDSGELYPSAFKWFKENFPMAYEQGFAIQFKSDLTKISIEEQNRLIDSFDDRVILEGLPFEKNTIMARLRSYARSWLANLEKEKRAKKDRGRM